MTRKKKIIISSATVAAAFAVMCTAGVTLALSTAGNRSNGNLTTADLNLSATAKNVKVYSAVRSFEGESGAFGNEDIGFYKYEQSTVQGVDRINFSNHEGAVEFDGEKVSIENFMPGDKVEFDIEVSSTSTISFNYRAELYVDASRGAKLLNQLDFSAGELGLRRNDAGGAAGGWELSEAILTDYTEWTTFGSNSTNIENVHVTVSLPIDRTEGQGESVKLYYVASGIQNTVSQEDVVRFETAGGGSIGFKTVKEGVKYARENDIVDIPVVGSTVLEEGEIIVDSVLHFNGVADESGNYPVLKGARFIIQNSAAATFESIDFAGASYIDVSRATALKLAGCRANVEPVKYFDSVTREFLSDSAFIVSSATLTPVRLTLTDNTFISGGGSAVNLRSLLNSGSEIANNTFGSQDRAYNGTAVLVFNGSTGGDSVITFADNRLYGSRALELCGTNESPYLVISRNNTAYGLKDNIFVGGTAGGAFVDSGSKIGGNALQCANIADGALAFGGVDVSLNNLNRITAGKIALYEKNITVSAFYNKFVVGSTLEKDALGLYKDGALYAYLNASSEAEAGYTVDAVG